MAVGLAEEVVWEAGRKELAVGSAVEAVGLEVEGSEAADLGAEEAGWAEAGSEAAGLVVEGAEAVGLGEEAVG